MTKDKRSPGAKQRFNNLQGSCNLLYPKEWEKDIELMKNKMGVKYKREVFRESFRLLIKYYDDIIKKENVVRSKRIVEPTTLKDIRKYLSPYVDIKIISLEDSVDLRSALDKASEERDPYSQKVYIDAFLEIFFNYSELAELREHKPLMTLFKEILTFLEQFQ